MQTLGIVDCIWNGKSIEVEKGAKFKPGGMKNSVVTTARRPHHSQAFETGEVKVTTILARGQSFKAMYSTEPGELQIICDTGQSFVWSEAFMTELLEATGGEGGKIEITWAVDEGEELLNG